MKNILIIAWIMLSSSLLFAQKTKTVEIWKKPMSLETMNAIYSFDKKGDLVNIEIFLRGQNCEYMYITDFITIFRGSPIEFYGFLNQIEKFCIENEAGVSSEVMGRIVSRGKSAFTEIIKIEGQKKDVFYGCPIKWIPKFKSKFIAWCKK
ncbi:MAG: hypothetical protein RRY39_08110, partial [Odoribacter sp.]